MTEESMLDYVRTELRKRSGQWRIVADDTGISKRTLEKLAIDDPQNESYIADPGIQKIEKLAKYFRNRDSGGSAGATIAV